MGKWFEVIEDLCTRRIEKEVRFIAVGEPDDFEHDQAIASSAGNTPATSAQRGPTEIGHSAASVHGSIEAARSAFDVPRGTI
jgi:hypothetical protein